MSPPSGVPAEILVTNDDGVRHAGLAALAAALEGLGRISVLAPDRNWSASGHVKTMHKPLRIEEAAMADGRPALASNGAPSDCVALALHGALGHEVEVVVSGVNPFPNLGYDLTYSGTVTAAMEAAIAGVGGVAVSRARDAADQTAADVAREIVGAVLERGLPPHTLLNVNVPAEPRGVRVTRQGLRTYVDALDRRTDPGGRPYYWIGGRPTEEPPEPGSDMEALKAGFVSVTPIQLDLTNRRFLPALTEWPWDRVLAPAS